MLAANVGKQILGSTHASESYTQRLPAKALEGRTVAAHHGKAGLLLCGGAALDAVLQHFGLAHADAHVVVPLQERAVLILRDV